MFFYGCGLIKLWYNDTSDCDLYEVKKRMLMKAIIIPDSFKGSMSSLQAAAAMERGLKSVFEKIDTVCLPVADGGEGTIEVFKSIGFGKTIKKQVTGPMGEKTDAQYILADDGRAVIEMAQASGLALLRPVQRSPQKATTYGTGELILDAVKNGAKKILLAIGGSATNDGGTGMAQALGASYKNAQGKEIGFGCESLKELAAIDETRMLAHLQDVKIEVACDVQNMLCGKMGASMVYGPQKGADEQTAIEMDGFLINSQKSYLKNRQEMRSIPGTGAAGGTAVPLIAFANAKIVSGIDAMLSYIEFEKHLIGADIILTGEGRIDEQTIYGKAVAGIAKAAKRKNVPVIAFAGILGKGYSKVFSIGVQSCFSIVPGIVSTEEAMIDACDNLEGCVMRVARLLQMFYERT